MSKAFILGGILLLSSTMLGAQNVMILQDPVSSKNFNSEKYSGIRGTPFLMDKWIKGTVTTPVGVYQNLELKLNVYDNIIVYNKQDEPFELTDKIINFTLMVKESDPSTWLVFRKDLSGGDLSKNQYVQVLYEGKVGLYKQPTKQLAEISEINAGIVKTFSSNSKYYLLLNNVAQFVRLNKTELLDALKDKKDQLQIFITDKKLSFKKETDAIDLLKYYNTLQ
jgi:hypothetical protein